MDVSKGIKVFPLFIQVENEEGPILAKFNQLSKREKEIAMMVVQGNSSVEIAEKLFLSLLTVNTHRRNLFQKLGFKNLAQLSAFLRKLKEN
jgi:DNA-binding CsgD family transcriptional regulator